ncbi:MAG: phosphatase PAP2 family protein [Treponema sp.]|nr:phosphatase PAP2 family protein [Treponema sp.]
MNDNIIIMLSAENPPLLHDIYRWGIEVIKVIQKIESPVLTAVVKFITALGTEALYIPLIVFIFWWIDEKQGLRFGILLVMSAWINLVIKDVLKQPRPFNFEPALGLASEPTYGAPSGHAQNSLVFWIPVAAWLSQKWANINAGQEPEKGQLRKKVIIWISAIVLLLLIGFTRLYLGVHFPTDLFLGWFIAGIILVIWFIPGPRLEALISSAGTRYQNIIAAVIALVMNGLFPKDRSFPALLLGFCIGYTLMKSKFPFEARGKINGENPHIKIMFLRCFMGFLGLAVIYMGLRLIFPGEGSLFHSIPLWGAGSPFYEIGRFVRYGLLGLWASAGAPMIFMQMGIAEKSVGSNGGENS